MGAGLIMIIGLVAVVVLLLFVVVPTVYIKNYIKVPPNQVAVFTGRGGTPKIVHGGARFRIPGIERVDFMSLEPFNVFINLQNVLSSNGVPVNVEAVGLVRIGSADEAVQTAVQRFLNTDPRGLQSQINEILAGSLRGITATMTVEELNSDRDRLARNVVDEAGGDLRRIGMEVDVIKIAGISDHNGYLESLGQRRIAEVKRDATIGTAEAERDSQIRSAQARQAGSIAQAEADTAIAQASQKRDVEIARMRALTESENATADQAGPLSEARAQKDVLIAKEQAEAARVEASIEVQKRRAEERQAALQADVIAPAEAEQLAAVKRAEGLRQAEILQAEARAAATRQQAAAQADAARFSAEAQAQATRASGEAQAESRKAAAAALLAEQQAEAAGLQARLTAEAEGLRAKLDAEAAGKKQVAEALNSYSDVAARIETLPDVLAALVAATEAAAKPVGALEKVTIIGNAGEAQASISALLGLSPQMIAKTLESLKASGVDLAGWLAQASAGGSVPAAPQTLDIDLGLD